MTQTPRDWQKDMRKVEVMRDARTILPKEFQQDDPVEDVLFYWLQEAKFWKGQYESASDDADETQRLYELEKARADAAEDRVKKLEAIIKAANAENEILLNGEGDEAYAEAWSTLYPDTPAPKEEGNNQ